MSDWVTAKLKDVAKVVTGKTPQTSVVFQKVCWR